MNDLLPQNPTPGERRILVRTVGYSDTIALRRAHYSSPVDTGLPNLSQPIGRHYGVQRGLIREMRLLIAHLSLPEADLSRAGLMIVGSFGERHHNALSNVHWQGSRFSGFGI